MDVSNRSPLRFTIPERSSIPAAEFALSNTAIGALQYDYDATWAFCRFDDAAEIIGLRFGFGRGKVEWGDIAMQDAMSEMSLVLTIEVMTGHGAFLWHSAGQFTQDDIDLHDNGTGVSLRRSAVLEMHGWPNPHWEMKSDDGGLTLDLELDLHTVAVLPDWILPNTLFSMWLAYGRISGEVTINDTSHHVNGTVFLDHPRTNYVSNDILPLDWYLYTPIIFDDNSAFISYNTVLVGETEPAPFNFAVLLRDNGQSVWFDRSVATIDEIDDDNKPSAWSLVATSSDLQADARIAVQSTTVEQARAHGWVPGDGVMTRRDNPNIPLVLNADVSISDASGGRRGFQARGLGEHIARGG